MLKIRNDVDLKELEKYGFKEIIDGCYEFRSNKDYSSEETPGNIAWLYVSDYDNELLTVIPNIAVIDIYETQNILYDLIKDGLVEKID